MFNFSTEELLGRLMELLLPQLLKAVSYTHLDVYKRQAWQHRDVQMQKERLGLPV